MTVASLDFPRGWTASAFLAGGGPTITIPAAPGVAHVLDSFSVKIINNDTATDLIGHVTLSTSGGTYTGFQLALLAVGEAVTGPPASLGSDQASETGLNLATAIGESLTVAAPGGALTDCLLTIQGHDI